jgi:predicted helicase
MVIRTQSDGYWAVQCKCYKADARIDKPAVDTFLSTSGKTFFDVDEPGKKVSFEFRLWIDTTLNGFNTEAENTIQGQTPPVGKLNYYELANAPVDWKKLDKGVSGERAAGKKYSPKPHQQTAIDQVHDYLKTHDRGNSSWRAEPEKPSPASV